MIQAEIAQLQNWRVGLVWNALFCHAGDGAQTGLKACIGRYWTWRRFRRLRNAAVAAKATTSTQIDVAMINDKTSWDMNLATPLSERLTLRP